MISAEVRGFARRKKMVSRLTSTIGRRCADTVLLVCFSPVSSDSALGVADYAGVPVDDACFDLRADGEVRGGWVAARVGDELSAPHFFAMKFGDGIDRVRQQVRGGVVFFI